MGAYSNSLDKMSNKAAKVGDNILGGLKGIKAANMAHEDNENKKAVEDALNGKHHGTIYRAVETAGDTVVDVANYATLGLARRIGNLFDDKDSKIDYKAYKQAKKSGEVNVSSSANDRANYLVNSSIETHRADRGTQSEDTLGTGSSGENESQQENESGEEVLY